jgi:CHASE2 domain-containing sensor protein
MSRGAPGRRIVGLLAVALIAAGIGVALHAERLLTWLERPSVDARFSVRGSHHPASNVVVVGIDKDSTGNLPLWPFSRRLHARAVDNLHAAGARVIVYDVTFERPVADEGASVALLEAARHAAPVVFAAEHVGPHGETEVLGGDANLREVGARAGVSLLDPDGDGVIRHVLGQVNGLPALAAVAAQAFAGRPPNAGQLRGAWIDFAGPPGTVPSLSFLSVLRGRFDRRAVRGKVVVIGATAPGLQDLHSTAAGSPMSGPEVQANAIATVLARYPLRSTSGVVTVVLIVALALLVPLAGVRLETAGIAVVGLGAGALWTLATQLAFNSGVVLDYSDPLAGLLLGGLGAVILGMWADSRERRQLRLLFAAGEPALVEQVLHAPGERRIEPTSIIAGYRIEREIGRGGMGVVYRASQLALGRAVAVKLITTERAQDPEFRARFAAESRIAASIEHPNVIPVYEAGEDDGLLFIVMRLVEGMDLAHLLESAGPLEPDRAVRVIAQVASALDAAHARGLVHRDVKPANMLLTLDEREHAYLTDFGVAKRVGALTGVTKTGRWVGTLDYVSPEQIRGEQADASADIYALACVLYRCLTGRAPFHGDTQAAVLWAHLSAIPSPVSRVRPELPQELDAVIARGMAKEPSERFASAGALARALAHAAEPGAVEAIPPTPPRRPGDAPEAPDDSAPTMLAE